MALLILEALLPSSLCVCPHLAELQLSLCTQSPGGPSLGFYSASPRLTVMVVPQGCSRDWKDTVVWRAVQGGTSCRGQRSGSIGRFGLLPPL